MATDVVQVTFTGDDEAVVGALVDALVADGLACGQVSGPVRSVYRWRGAVEENQEWRAVLKTSAARSSEVVARIRSGHPYETPEVVVTPVIGGDPDYLAWILEESTRSER